MDKVSLRRQNQRKKMISKKETYPQAACWLRKQNLSYCQRLIFADQAISL
jgi:hypothetical protein